MLTKNDLQKIGEIVDERITRRISENNRLLFKTLASKEDLEATSESLKKDIDKKISGNNLLLFEKLATKEDLKELWEKACDKFATKEQLAKVQDLVVLIKNKLDTEYRFIQKRGEGNAQEIEKIKQVLTLNSNPTG